MEAVEQAAEYQKPAVDTDDLRFDLARAEAHASEAGPEKHTFLASVLAAAQARGDTLTVTALNDYAVSFPRDLAVRHGALLAMDHAGRPMRIRDKGPIWIVFPLTETEAADAPFDNQMVWQLAKVHVGP